MQILPFIRKWRWRMITGAIAIVCLVLIKGLLPAEEKGDPLVNKFLFHPTPFHQSTWEEPDFEYEEVWLVTSDNVKINAWYMPAENPIGVVLFSHGNAGNLSGWGYVGDYLRKTFNVSVLVYDYRGYGKSEGTPNVPGILKDAHAAQTWLCEKTSLPPEKLIYQGRSLGGAVAVDLAVEAKAKGLVIESSFMSIPKIAEDKLPLIPTGMLIRYRLDSLKLIKEYEGHLLQCHSENDTVIPYSHGIELFKAAKTEKKKFVTLKNLDHNDQLPQYYDDELKRFYEFLAKTE